MPNPNSASRPTTSSTHAKGLKGLFARARMTSPEPSDPGSSTRARIRNFVNDARPSTSRKSSQPPGVPPKDGRPRVGSPDRSRRKGTIAPSALPAIQRGDDGKWQPPSLSRGSMSTGALAMYADEEERGMQKAGKGKGVDRQVLTVLFGQGVQDTRSGALPSIDTRLASSARTGSSSEEKTVRQESPRKMRAGAQSSDTTPPTTPTLKSQHTPTLNFSPRGSSLQTTARRDPPPPLTIRPDIPNRSTSTRNLASISTPPTPKRPDPTPPGTRPPSATKLRPRSTSRSRSTSNPIPNPEEPPLPTRTSLPATLPPLSREHYLLRLSTTFLVKALTPIIRGSSFVQNDKNVEMRRLADDRLSALGRMEKGWGGEWAKAGEVGVGEEGSERGLEGKVRSVGVGERAKERERKSWVDAIRDGILLCFLLNHLFPSHPPHIARVNISEDGILRATNLTRFITACQAVGLSDAEIFGLHDIQEGTETALGRAAGTVIALARLAGKSAVGAGRGSRPVSPAASPPTSPRRAVASPTRSSQDRGISMERQRSADKTNDLHAKLQTVTVPSAAAIDDLAFKTPTTSTFDLPPDTVAPKSPGTASASGSSRGGSLIRPSPLNRSVTQPNISPSPRPKSPPVSASPSRSNTPIGRTSNLGGGGRPILRPRHTTGSKIQVSFAESKDVPSPPRTALPDRDRNYSHSRERTPSLISSGSRVTSGYTRSSAALSVATVVGDESHSPDFEDDEVDGVHVTRLKERRMSEKTLQDARQRILGKLLSSEDLPKDLQDVIALQSESYVAKQDDARGVAISQSLAALEGWRAPPPSPRTSVEGSPRRPGPRRGQSLEVGRQDVSRVLEEDEASSNGGSSIEGYRPNLIRRLSAKTDAGKVYIPKRSTSPSPAAPGFPFPSSMPDMSSGYLSPTRPGSRGAEKRNSGGGWSASESMVNLHAGPPSMFRENSSQSVLKGSGSPLQILEFVEDGCAPVRYQLGNCIGRGQFGSVYRSLNLSTGQMVAIKRIRLHGMREDEVKEVMREVELLKRLSHPSIVKYEGMRRDEEYLNIVLEFVENGSLGQTLKSFGRFNERLVSSYVAKILEGLNYLHSQGVVHCDLKAANILSTKNGNVKLSDFGVSLNMKAVENIKQDAVTASKGKIPAARPVSEVAGTPNWMAPEVISLNGASTASDIWSLGCTIIELLTGKPPYSDIGNSMSVLFRIVEDDMPPLPEDISDDLTDFLKLCFIKDPKARPEAVVMFEHPWVRKLNPEMALRPQDSVPFLRRVSMDLRRVDSARVFSPDLSAQPLPRPSSLVLESTSDLGGRRTRFSIASSHGRDGSDGGGYRDHALIKTTFSKAIICRICHTSVKRVGVLCQHCGLICHTSCASKASPRCDINEQIALLARQQEILSLSPSSHGPSAASSRRPSFNDPSHDCDHNATPFGALPTKLLNGWKRSKSMLRDDEQVEERRRRKSSGNHGTAASLVPRPSIDTQPSEGSRRASMFTESDAGGVEDARRRSGIRFEVDGLPNNIKSSEMDRERGGKKVDVEVVHRPMSSLGARGHVRGKDSKSDCRVM